MAQDVLQRKVMESFTNTSITKYRQLQGATLPTRGFALSHSPQTPWSPAPFTKILDPPLPQPTLQLPTIIILSLLFTFPSHLHSSSHPLGGRIDGNTSPTDTSFDELVCVFNINNWHLFKRHIIHFGVTSGILRCDYHAVRIFTSLSFKTVFIAYLLNY